MKRGPIEIIVWTVMLLLLLSLLQTNRIGYYYQTVPLFKVYFWTSVLLMILCIIFLVRNFIQKNSWLPYVWRKFKSLSIPRTAKYVIIIVLIGNTIAISFGKQRFPFYDVGMYRWPKDFIDRDKIVYEAKYYYWHKGQYKILELRKEASFFLAEHFGWGYSHDFSYCTTYFHKGEKENFLFLSRAMKERGIDTLWVGIHSVNFETHAVTFDPDLCNAIKINQTVDLYYGPIYIPEYQMQKCDAH